MLWEKKLERTLLVGKTNRNRSMKRGSKRRINPKRKKRTFVIEVCGKLVAFQDGSWQEVKIGVISDVDDRASAIRGSA